MVSLVMRHHERVRVHHSVEVGIVHWPTRLAVTKHFLCLCRAHTWYNNILPPVFRDAERQIAKEQAVLDAREHTRRYNSVRSNTKIMPSLPLPGPECRRQSCATHAPW